MIFDSIMKRLQMATERICETECEMKTLKEWKVDLTYKQPQIKIVEKKKTKQHMPITIMEKEGTFEDTKKMAVKSDCQKSKTLHAPANTQVGSSNLAQDRVGSPQLPK